MQSSLISPLFFQGQFTIQVPLKSTDSYHIQRAQRWLKPVVDQLDLSQAVVERAASYPMPENPKHFRLLTLQLSPDFKPEVSNPSLDATEASLDEAYAAALAENQMTIEGYEGPSDTLSDQYDPPADFCLLPQTR